MSAGSLELLGIDGAVPLGFLAALGTLVTAHQAGETLARLRWRRARAWIPVLDGISTSDPVQLSDMIASALRGKPISQSDEQIRKKTQRASDAAKKAAKDKEKEIRNRGLSKEDRKIAITREVRPLEQVRDEQRQLWLEALKKAVSRPELAIGRKIDCTYEEYRQHGADFLVGANHRDREPLDLLAAFGSDACRKDNSDAIIPTLFYFTTGSGQQYFLDTVRQLMDKATSEVVQNALFEPWTYQDEKLSLRWDPSEDRRYALMDRDPSDSSSRTVWMANLLAYRALTLFSCAPGRWGLTTTSWASINEELTFTWPIWEFPATPDLIRSMLQLKELVGREVDGSVLRARGVTAAFRSRRIEVGAGANVKLNFTPARGV